MTKRDVMNAVHQGNLIVCTEEEYQNKIRRYLHECAGQYIDNGDGLRAGIALNEIKRLNSKYGVG